MTSRPRVIRGIVAAWTGVGWSNPRASTAASTPLDRPKSAKPDKLSPHRWIAFRWIHGEDVGREAGHGGRRGFGVGPRTTKRGAKTLRHMVPAALDTAVSTGDD